MKHKRQARIQGPQTDGAERSETSVPRMIQFRSKFVEPEKLEKILEGRGRFSALRSDVMRAIQNFQPGKVFLIRPRPRDIPFIDKKEMKAISMALYHLLRETRFESTVDSSRGIIIVSERKEN